jgi:hypothetical protein
MYLRSHFIEAAHLNAFIHRLTQIKSATQPLCCLLISSVTALHQNSPVTVLNVFSTLEHVHFFLNDSLLSKGLIYHGENKKNLWAILLFLFVTFLIFFLGCFISFQTLQLTPGPT